MEISTSTVYKCLEKKTLIFGFEIMDLFVLSFILCLLNFVFNDSAYKLFYTFIPTFALAAGLRITKRGQADGFLVHWLRYHLTPGIIQAFPSATQTNELLKIRKST